ncbi:MAG: hypothetical protein AAGD25_14135 [Cyanobacteria bacterium P01_F01_bin.150]
MILRHPFQINRVWIIIKAVTPIGFLFFVNSDAIAPHFPGMLKTKPQALQNNQTYYNSHVAA